MRSPDGPSPPRGHVRPCPVRVCVTRQTWGRTPFAYLGDRPALNHVILFNLTAYQPARLAFPFTSPLCSHGTYALIRNAHGKVLTDVGGEPFAVVHMVNRHCDVKDGKVTDLIYPNKFRSAFVPKSDRLIFTRNGNTRYGIYQWNIEHRLPLQADRGPAGCLACDVRSPRCLELLQLYDE